MSRMKGELQPTSIASELGFLAYIYMDDRVTSFDYFPGVATSRDSNGVTV